MREYPIPDDLKLLYETFLLEAADNGGEFVDDDADYMAFLIERIATAEGQVTELKAKTKALKAKNKALREENAKEQG